MSTFSKTILWLMGFLCLYLPQVQGQFQIPADYSFYTFLDSFYLYHQDDSTEGGIYNHTKRYAMTWGARLAPTGKMTVANRAMLAYSRQYKGVTVAQGVQGGQVNLPTNHAAAKDWVELGPNKELVVFNNGFGRGIGQIHRIGFHPKYNGTNNSIIYAGSHYGGLFRSDNGGQNWYNYHTDRGLPITSIGGIAVSDSSVFVCTGNGDHGYANFGQNALYAPLRGNINNYNPIHTQGVYKIRHTDNQWIPINGSHVDLIDTTANDLLEVFEYGGTMRQIIVHPTNENILFIATSQGIFRTQNGGNTWVQVFATIPDGNGNQVLDTEWRGLVFHPTNPNIIYASGQDVYRSVDGGGTWASMTNNQAALTLPDEIRRINIAVTPAAPNYLYAFVVGRYTGNNLGFGHVYLFDGQQWVLQNNYTNRIDECSPDWATIAVSPVDPSYVLVGGITLRSSTNVSPSGSALFVDNGQSSHLHDDIHVIKFNNDTSNVALFFGTHGGVSETINPPSSQIRRRYNGLGVSTIWTFDDWEADDNLIVTGNQDVGIQYTTNLGQNWIYKFGGDGYGVRIDEQAGNAFFKQNHHYSIKEINNGFSTLDEVPNVPEMKTILPLDSTTTTGYSSVPNVYPHVNHPKTEESYIGFTELYLRKEYVAPDSIINARMDTSLVIKKLPGHIHIVASHLPGAGNTEVFALVSKPCTGNFIDTVTHIFPSLYANRYSARIDTLCEVEEISLRVDTSNIIDYLWEIKSNLESFQSQEANRRIQEIAFAEDEQSDHTYIATLGDNKSRRADFYVNSTGSSCPNCFTRKTSNLPKDSTVSSSIRDPNPITGIAVDPLDGRRVWVSFSGYSRLIKVYYSDDAGDNWISYDDLNGSLANLNMPINNIVYQRGTKDRLYIATDVGVYVREGNGNWQRYGENFPNVRTTELKINYCSGKLRAATFGRGVWENDLLPPETSPAYRSFRIISGMETWDRDKHMSRDLLIKAGASLILDSMILNMPKNGLIVIEQGGELQVLGSTITNLCGETWAGIEVWGNAHLSQQNNSNQGQIVLIDSRIEYAKNGLRNWQLGHIQHTGGILQASNSTFYNNWRSIEMMRYDIEQSDFSFLDGCTFEVDNNYRGFDGDTTQQFLGHVSMWGIANMSIRGCTFKDSRINKRGDQNQGGCYGILGLNASPKLGSLPQGTGSAATFLRNHFEGLERGIELSGDPISGRAVIDQSNFLQTEQAILLRAIDGVIVLRDSFFIGGFQNPSSVTKPLAGIVEHFGLGLTGSANYTIEQNYFSQLGNATTTIGSWIESSGKDVNRIHNNQYQGLTGGNLAHGRNQNASFPINGLKYTCIENSGNEHDFVVLDNIYSNSGTASIARTQGASGQAARNSFSSALTTFPNQSQFYNFNSNIPITYYYSTTIPNQIPDTNYLYSVNLFPAIHGNNAYCQNQYNNLLTTNLLSANDVVYLKEQYQEANQTHGQAKELYDNIPTADSTAKAAAADQLASWEAERHRWLQQIIQYYLNDPMLQKDSIMVWMQRVISLEGQYRLVEFYWQQKDYQTALNYLQDISYQFDLSPQEATEYEQYIILKETLKRAFDQGKQLHNLEYSTIETLEEITDLQVGRPSLQAKGILRFFYQMKQAEAPYLELSGSQRSNYKEPPIPPKNGFIKASPNPAINWASISYQLPPNVEAGEVNIVHTSGQNVFQKKLSITNNNYSKNFTFECNKLVGGTYFIILTADNGMSFVDQFVIIKP